MKLYELYFQSCVSFHYFRSPLRMRQSRRQLMLLDTAFRVTLLQRNQVSISLGRYWAIENCLELPQV